MTLNRERWVQGIFVRVRIFLEGGTAMRRSLRVLSLAVLCILIIAVPSVWAYWVQDGVAICTATGDQNWPTITSDGAGGAIVTWQDTRDGSNDIYVQRVNASGAVQWATSGVALSTATGDQVTPAIVSDGAGGAIVAWRDFRGSNWDISAQRVNASGAVQWTANGVHLCEAPSDRREPAIVSDGAGGAIVTWMDYRSWSNWGIYAQRVNALGAVQWTADGVALCMATSDQYGPTITSDGAGGAIVTWYDMRSGNADIYAQKVDALGAVQWTTDGVALCTATGDQGYPTIVSDVAGGAIVTWFDGRSGNYDIYAQRVNASGSVLWTTDSVALCTATGDQYYPTITSDGAGGAIVTWHDFRNGNCDIYAGKVNASGAVEWATNGVALCTATGTQQYPRIISDDVGGAIVTWEDHRSGTNWDTYAQRVSASGVVQWTSDGVALCMATGDQSYTQSTMDGAGGAIVTWHDYRSGSADIYAQSVNAAGRVGLLGPDVLSVKDVPHDQGGRVRITMERSKLDATQESVYPVLTYNVWQRIDNPALLAKMSAGNGAGISAASTRPELAAVAHASGWPIKESNGRYFVRAKDITASGGLPSGTWELVGSYAAAQQAQYIYRAGTLADSAASGIPYSVYFVSAHTTTPSVWYASFPDSGYSVDNIPPEAPVGLDARQSFSPIGLALSWSASAANDLSHYAVYRGLTEDFVPGPGNRAAALTAHAYFDGGWRWSSGYYYRVSAIDIHGNESGFALLTPNDVTGTETPKAPDASYLSQNYPNPFNPATRIAYGLSAPGHVSLRIYDAAGRLVRDLVNEERPAGRYEASWDGRDSNGRAVASGIYFYRLGADDFEGTKKMILVK
jgi:hypothetical protein